MKKIITILFLFAGISFAGAQSLDRFVIASSGDYAQVSSITISYTVGELAAVESFLGNPLMHLTQGFQQPEEWYKGVEEIKMDSQFAVFPNPAADKVAVRFLAPTDGTVRIRLYNVLAQTIKDQDFFTEIGRSDYLLDLTGISQGLYLIELSGKQGGKDFSFSEKLNVIK